MSPSTPGDNPGDDAPNLTGAGDEMRPSSEAVEAAWAVIEATDNFPDFVYEPFEATADLRAEVRARNLAVVRQALAAALPIIRRDIAEEIEAERDVRYPWQVGMWPTARQMWTDAARIVWTDAARIARGEVSR